MRLRQSAAALASRCSAEVLAGRYRLDALIGSGGAADVHRGFDLRLRRPVAVKVFRTGTDADMEERFSSEAVILARLQHPGLVTAYDAGRHGGRPFLVMQLIDGPTLKSRIAQGPLTPRETAALGAALARALAHAHRAGIVHRDVKPSNIVLDVDGRPHLTDFGISRLLDATTRTATGALIGTAAYLSPEQVLGRPVGRPADVYALGLVLLECLKGRLEYDGAPLEAAIARLHRRPVLPGGVPQELAALLGEMTALEERERPGAADCARRLAALTPVTAPACTAAPAPATSVVAERAPVREEADATHRDPQPAARRPAPARGRVLAAGASAALAAAVAAAFTVSDGRPPQESDARAARAADRPAQTASPHTPAAGDRTASSPAARDTAAARPAPLPSTASRTPAAAVEGPARYAAATPDPGTGSGSGVVPEGRTPGSPAAATDARATAGAARAHTGASGKPAKKTKKQEPGAKAQGKGKGKP